MTTLARPHGVSGRLLLRLLISTSLIALAIDTSAGAAPAHGRRHRHAHHHGRISRRAHAHLASLAAPSLTVVAHKLVWSPVDGVSTYVFARQQPGLPTYQRLLTTTSLTPRAFPGATVTYSVRTNVEGSEWAEPVTIVYNRWGGIARILEHVGSGSGSGSWGSGSGGSGGGSEGGAGSGGSGSGGAGSGSGSSGSGSGGSGSSSGSSGSGSSGSGSSGSGSGSSGSGSGGSGSSGSGSGKHSVGGGSHSHGGSGSGSSGSGSGSSGSGSGGSGSGSGSGGGEGSGGGGSPVEEQSPLPDAGLKIGLIGGVVGWGAAPSETIRNATGVRYTRLDPEAEGWAPAEEMVSDGVTPLAVYNPGLQGMSPAAVAEGVARYLPHMVQLGMTELELGNEVYYHNSTPGEYAAQYRAAHEALAGSGITLIANAWTDTPKPNGEWSQWENGGGWCMLFVEALGYVPDAWSFHPYGPMSADGFGAGAYRTGWDTVPRMIAYMKADHIYAPLNITEVGQPTYQGSDGNAAVSPGEQAADVKQYLTQAAEWGLASVYLYEAIDTGEGGYGLWSWPLKAKPAAAVFAETLAALSAPSAAPSSL